MFYLILLYLFFYLLLCNWDTIFLTIIANMESSSGKHFLSVNMPRLLNSLLPLRCDYFLMVEEIVRLFPQGLCHREGGNRPQADNFNRSHVWVSDVTFTVYTYSHRGKLRGWVIDNTTWILRNKYQKYIQVFDPILSFIHFLKIYEVP